MVHMVSLFGPWPLLALARCIVTKGASIHEPTPSMFGHKAQSSERCQTTAKLTLPCVVIRR